MQSDQRLHAGHTRYTLPLVDLGALLSEVQHARGLLAAGLGGENSTVADSYYQQIQPANERITRLWAEYKAALADAPPNQGSGNLARIEAALGANQQAADKVLGLARAGSFEDAIDQMRGDSAKRFDTLRAAVIETMKTIRGASQNAFDAATRANASARGLLLAALGFGLVAGTVLTMLAARKVRAMLAESIEIAQAVAAGDLSRTIVATGNDETAHLRRTLAEMQASLVALVLRVKGGAQGVAAGSSEIALSNQDLSSRTEMQASALQQTAASMEQLNATVRQNAESARQANQLAQSASTVVARGARVVDQVVETMKHIDESSKHIADIIGASVARVEQGSTLADQAGQTMQEVQSSIGRVARIVAEISAASAEQATGVDLVDRTSSQMDETTQQNAALVEQGAAAAESLRQQAADLVEAVAAFRLAPGAEAAAATA